MKPEGIRKVIAEQSLEGAIIYLAEHMEAGAAEKGHEENSVLYQLQGKLEQLEDRVARLEGAPIAPAPATPAGEGA